MTRFVPQPPADGVLFMNSDNSYREIMVPCTCLSPEHNHIVFVSNDDGVVSVNVYTTVTTNYWSDWIKVKNNIESNTLQRVEWFIKGLINTIYRKLKLTKDVWFSTHLEYEADLLLTEQQAINYSAALKTAVEELAKLNNDTNFN